MSFDLLIKYISRYVPLTQEEVDQQLSKIRLSNFKKGDYVVQNNNVCK